MTRQPGPEPSDELGPESLLDPGLEPEEQKRLDDLVAAFEDDMRHRPTPMELDEEDGGGKGKPRRKKPAVTAKAEPAAATEPVEAGGAAGEELEPTPATLATEPLADAASESPMLPFDAAPVTAEVPPAAPALLDASGGIDSWWEGGERIRVELPSSATYEIFTRTAGSGPWLTLLHGCPTSSYDWAPMVEALSQKYHLLMFDLLGFGDSDKPTGHDWSAFEQADIVEALWRHFGVDKTRVLAHDVGATVALELIARRDEGGRAAQLEQVTLLNGGIYSGFHRPRPMQVWLQRPVAGALIARMLSEGRFGSALSEVFGATHQPSPEELHQHWLSVARRNGGRNYHRLIRYIPERRAQAGRWEQALDGTDVPLKFVWGMADPVSGAHMIEVVRDRRRGANIVELAGVGHYPQLEAPAEVARAVLS